jgi:hypothetical protein
MSEQMTELRAADFAVPRDVANWRIRALGVGAAGLILSVFGGIFDLDTFLRGYLIGFMFCTGASLGCMGLLMIQYLTGGFWGLSIRRVLEAAAKNIYIMGLLFLPLLFLRFHLWAWMSNPALTKQNGWYLNQFGWLSRYVVYFLIWMFLVSVLMKRGDRQDAPYTPGTLRFQGFSGIGLVLYALSASFAVVDWVMSLDPHWGSTIYGLIFLVGQGLTALCFSVIMLTVLTRYQPYSEIIKPTQFHDIGKLTLAFVMLFAYFSFSQWLIIWSGNLPDEISFYLRRIHGGFGWVMIGIILLHFALPFALLLSRDRKRAGRRLIPIAILLLCMRLVDLYWYTIPNFPDAKVFSIWYLAGPIMLIGIWLAVFFTNFQRRPLLPLYEPQVPFFLHQKAGHGH